MTYEEAIKELENIKGAISAVYTFTVEEKKEAVNMAIEALAYKAKVKKYGSELAMAIAEYHEARKRYGYER